MAKIRIGATREEKLSVSQDVTIDFMGLEGARVLSTPNMILGLERASRNAVLPMLDPGYDTVGTHVDVYHLAATPIGMTVTFRTEITSVDDRRVNFKVEAFDEKEKIGEGTHQRFIVNAARFAARVQEKAR
ncbi:MAG TPA: thioesterase family protein [Bryobacteraceae bacterium]|nr:thioesterase family protein [Bryobacteraceae bacterium]